MKIVGDRMKEKIKNVLKYVLTFVILMSIFNICLYLVCSFNSSSVEENVKESYETLAKEGMFYKLSDEFDLFNNNCTDAVIINESYSVDNKDPYKSYMKARKNYKEGLTTTELPEATGEGISVNYDYSSNTEIYEYGYDSIGELGDFINSRIHLAVNYGRYWHGYLVLYRPLLTIFNISEIRTFQLVTYTLLLVAFLYLVWKRFGKSCAIIFGLSLICSGYFSASYSLESSPVFLVTMISSIIFIKRIDKIKNFGIYFFIVGCVTNYVDYLTVPLISLGMISCLYMLKLIEDGKDWKECVNSLVRTTLLWGIGYACTWIFKWILYDLTINDDNNMISIGFTQSFFRMRRESDITSANFLYTIILIFGKSSLYVVLSMIVLFIVNKFKVVSENFNKKALPFILLSLYPLAWYILLINHTLIHNYFTYRQVLIFMLGILFAFHELLFPKKVKKDKKTVKK